jgi:predicted membrane protein
MTDAARPERNLPRLIIGVTVIAAGVLFTLDNLQIVQADTYLSYWPVVLVILGAANIVQSRRWTEYAWSLVLVVAGLWLLGENLGLVTMSIWRLSPLLLVLFGASMVWRAYYAGGGPAASASHPDAFIRGTAVMGGIDRASNSAEFRGGDFIAVMGGCKVDLRSATIAGGEAVIDVLAFMGGVELLIPRTWIVDLHVLPVMGGVTDLSRPDGTVSTQRLVVRGTVFMGGVDIKN